MRILIVSDYSPNEVHGIAIHVRHMVAEMRKLGHELLVYCCKSKFDLESEGYIDPVNLDVYYRMGLCITNLWNPGNSICLVPGISLFYSMTAWKPDILHMFYPSAVGLPVLSYAKMVGLKTYVTHHVDMIHYVGAYLPMSPCAIAADYIYTVGARIPAYLCADANLAPSLASMRKEFSFADRHFYCSYCKEEFNYEVSMTQAVRQQNVDGTVSTRPVVTKKVGGTCFAGIFGGFCRSICSNHGEEQERLSTQANDNDRFGEDMSVQGRFLCCPFCESSTKAVPISRTNFMVVPTSIPGNFSNNSLKLIADTHHEHAAPGGGASHHEGRHLVHLAGDIETHTSNMTEYDLLRGQALEENSPLREREKNSKTTIVVQSAEEALERQQGYSYQRGQPQGGRQGSPSQFRGQQGGSPYKGQQGSQPSNQLMLHDYANHHRITSGEQVTVVHGTPKVISGGGHHPRVKMSSGVYSVPSPEKATLLAPANLNMHKNLQIVPPHSQASLLNPTGGSTGLLKLNKSGTPGSAITPTGGSGSGATSAGVRTPTNATTSLLKTSIMGAKPMGSQYVTATHQPITQKRAQELMEGQQIAGQRQAHSMSHHNQQFTTPMQSSATPYMQPASTGNLMSSLMSGQQLDTTSQIMTIQQMSQQQISQQRHLAVTSHSRQASFGAAGDSRREGSFTARDGNGRDRSGATRERNSRDGSWTARDGNTRGDGAGSDRTASPLATGPLAIGPFAGVRRGNSPLHAGQAGRGSSPLASASVGVLKSGGLLSNRATPMGAVPHTHLHNTIINDVQNNTMRNSGQNTGIQHAALQRSGTPLANHGSGTPLTGRGMVMASNVGANPMTPNSRPATPGRNSSLTPQALNAAVLARLNNDHAPQLPSNRTQGIKMRKPSALGEAVQPMKPRYGQLSKAMAAMDDDARSVNSVRSTASLKRVIQQDAAHSSPKPRFSFRENPKRRLRKMLNVPGHMKIVLLVSRLAPEKQVDRAIRVVSRPELRSKYHLVIVGDGPVRQQLEELVVDRCYHTERLLNQEPGMDSAPNSPEQNSPKRMLSTLSDVSSYFEPENDRSKGLWQAKAHKSALLLKLNNESDAFVAKFREARKADAEKPIVVVVKQDPTKYREEIERRIRSENPSNVECNIIGGGLNGVGGSTSTELLANKETPIRSRSVTRNGYVSREESPTDQCAKGRRMEDRTVHSDYERSDSMGALRYRPRSSSLRPSKILKVTEDTLIGKHHNPTTDSGVSPRKTELVQVAVARSKETHEHSRRTMHRLNLFKTLTASTPHQFAESGEYFHNVTFVGAVKNDALPNYFYRAADLFLTCSESETFGITVIEALGCDLLPVLPRSSPVFREFYEEALGNLSMYDTEQGLVEVLQLLYGKSDIDVPRIRRKLRGKVFFSWREAAIATIQQYEKVLGGHVPSEQEEVWKQRILAERHVQDRLARERVEKETKSSVRPVVEKVGPARHW